MFKVTHAFDYSIVYFTGTEEECCQWVGAHMFEYALLAVIPQ